MTPRLPTEDQIQVRAYEIYLSHGAEDGHHLEDWLTAERELLEQSARYAAEEATTSAEPQLRRQRSVAA